MSSRSLALALTAVVYFAPGCDEPNRTEVTPPPADQQFAGFPRKLDL